MRRHSAPSGKDLLGIVLVYAVVASLWILLSDKALPWLFDDPVQIALAGTFKGWLFVAVTSLSLFGLLQRARRREGERRALLEAAEARLRATLDTALDAVIVMDTDGCLVEFNAAAERCFGYRRAELLGRRVDEHIIPERYREAHRLGLARYLETGLGRVLGTSMELSALRADGSEFPVELAINVAHVGTGDVFVTYLRDITERKRAEAELHEQDRMLSDMSTMAHIGGWFFDPATGQGSWTPECARIHDLPEDTPINVEGGLSYYLGEHRQRIEAAVSAACEDGTPYDLELEIRSATGRHKWIRTIGHPVVEEGQVVRVFGAFQDITAHKQAEERLRQSQAQLEAFIRHAPISIAMFDLDMRYLSYSGRWLEEYGRGLADLAGRSHYEVHPDVPPEWRDVHRQGLAGETIKNDADAWTQADGSRHWLRWAVLPWYDEGGEIGGIIISAEDITASMQAKREIEQLNATLEQRVVERTAELTAANGELDAFAYAVSHDLRAPLRAMSGFSQALLEDYGEQLQGEAKGYLEHIGIASRRMGALIDGILTLSRSTRGELQRDIVDLSALARRQLDELAGQEPARSVAVEVEPGLAMRGDGRMLEAAVVNLVDNAWKYSAKAAAPVIRVYGEQRGDLHWFCVADNGAGFDMAYAKRLFKPFQRLHRQDEFAGIGIGLATVQRIVHRHGGEIEAQGEPGKGARFCFTLGGGEGA
jgi:PAS domain S-box-containing protein